MTTLTEVMTDLRAEVATLDEVLRSLDDDRWFTETPSAGWDIRDTVAHLADTDDLMYESVTGNFTPGRVGLSEGGGVDDFTALQVERGRTMTAPDVYAWWRSATARLHDHIDHLDPAGRYMWGGNMISPLSLGSARLMETWAHSLDCFAAVGRDYVDTDRLRHVAFLGLRALPYAFSLAGVPAPGPVRVELASPAGGVWVFGPDDAVNVVRGTASDWCRLVAHRARGEERSRLRAFGPDASGILEHARAFL